MDNCWISYQVMADMKKVYDNFIIINLYQYLSNGQDVSNGQEEVSDYENVCKFSFRMLR